MILLLIFWKRKYLSTKFVTFWVRNQKAERVVEDLLKNCEFRAIRRYSYFDMKKITGSFKDKIGQGGYGGVYKGKLVDGRLVAVKLLNMAKGDGEEFINEVASISMTSHVNIVSLLGYCFDGSKRALVYDFMVNGSLEKFIHNKSPSEAHPHLCWETTLHQISIGVAKGLEYLHQGCTMRILHFDIKPHNILLDQDFTPKFSDFGLAKLCLRKESMISTMDARGTVGYIAPEVFSRNFGRVSHKSDVYSYGMMVLEMVGRTKIIVGVEHTSDTYFPHWVYKRLALGDDLKLPGVTSTAEEDLIKKMVLVALSCIQTNPNDRPTMSWVVEMLDGSHDLLSIPPKPYLSSPTRDTADSSDTCSSLNL